MVANLIKQGLTDLALCPTEVDHNVSGMELICRCSGLSFDQMFLSYDTDQNVAYDDRLGKTGF